MATAQFSVYTPQGLGTVPPASLAQNFVPAFGQGLLQVAKTYQARKSVEQAADEASALFKDPAYGNIFRQMGLAAVAQGESPTPIINSMLSTAINLRKDEDQMAQRERMMRMQFGQQTALENLRTNNNLRELGARQDFVREQNAPENLYNQQLGQMAATAQAQRDFSQSPLGQETAESRRAAENLRAKDKIAIEYDEAQARKKAQLGIPLNEPLVLPNEDETSNAELIESLGIDMTSPTRWEPAKVQKQIEIISNDPRAVREFRGRLNLLQEELDLIKRGEREKRDRTMTTPKKPSAAAEGRYVPL